jgi:hypothetical protein
MVKVTSKDESARRQVDGSIDAFLNGKKTPKLGYFNDPNKRN